MLNQKRIKFGVVVALGIVYFISFWLLTLGYFTPYWLLINLSSGVFDNDWIRDHPWYNPWYNPLENYNCNSIGLVKPTHNCDAAVYEWFKNKNEHGIGRILENTFILMTSAVVAVYTNAIMLIAAIVFDLFNHSLYMSVLAISFGVFYPMAAILILVASIYVEASYTSDTGFSAMLCTISGILMVIFYTGLIVYDRIYIKSGRKSNGKFEKIKHTVVNCKET